ncbi:hypothetical protein AF72_01455 [Xylella taiwanensis]|uniref:Uncharacterized protein n=1 Tax=Xylella taiwanensis TaxID=1444770 RepID=Z9JM54_9GAMM|nr:hypothetical protein AF72_01455 [Xylella taiwanensis]
MQKYGRIVEIGGKQDAVFDVDLVGVQCQVKTFDRLEYQTQAIGQ